MSKTSRPVRVGNMRQTSSYNPFPKDGGLVSQYERFMRKRVRHFYETYPHVSYDDLLSEAVRLAVHAATLFKPELGNDFSTYLGPHLMGLHRFAQSQTMQLPQPKDEPSREEIGEPVRPVEFGGGANGTRLTLDRQWLSGTITGQFARFKRHRIILGVQLPSADEDHARGVHQRISEDLDAVLADSDRESIRPGFLRFIVDNAE